MAFGSTLIKVGGSIMIGGGIITVGNWLASRKKSSSAPPAPPTPPTPQLDTTPEGVAYRYTVFGVKTRYLTTDIGPLHEALHLLSTRLLKPREHEIFTAVINDIDNILAADALLQGARVHEVASLPSTAIWFNENVKRGLRSIVTFSQEDMPSETKHAAMIEMENDICKILNDIIDNMQKILASMSVDRL